MAFILTAVGEDRPGLTQSLADAIHQAGGNWLESHFARLGGQYVGSVLVELPGERQGELEQAVRSAQGSGFTVNILPASGEAMPVGQPFSFEIVGEDRPGIVKEVSATLASLDVNIEDLETSTEDSAMFGAKLFRARANVLVPSETPLDQVRDALERISGEIMVDFEEAS